ncbi:MAG TPA: cache domain-containing protein [Ramlibacter sp.]|uniref:cache domain-containing protein n=1 Tax=Ramlibacter sp. TaxID=1917967 RepID=UPI002ED36345
MLERKKMLLGAALAAGLLAGTGAQAATERATAKEAETMVKKAVAHVKASGRQKALADFSDRNGVFVDRDLYITAYTMDGTNVAHPINPKMIGRNNMELRDMDGKEYVRERMTLAQTKSSFWQDYKFVDPITRKIEPKQMYCERTDDLVVCGGIYKR